mmetsp:Transcript_26443/g.77707  ORF Transcript_26443/g.77707 Transcript_26443/m.77707 type:complete len:238 (+) Transcript_26443:1127-1840(+)
MAHVVVRAWARVRVPAGRVAGRTRPKGALPCAARRCARRLEPLGTRARPGRAALRRGAQGRALLVLGEDVDARGDARVQDLPVRLHLHEEVEEAVREGVGRGSEHEPGEGGLPADERRARRPAQLNCRERVRRGRDGNGLQRHRATGACAGTGGAARARGGCANRDTRAQSRPHSLRRGARCARPIRCVHSHLAHRLCPVRRQSPCPNPARGPLRAPPRFALDTEMVMRGTFHVRNQ